MSETPMIEAALESFRVAKEGVDLTKSENQQY